MKDKVEIIDPIKVLGYYILDNIIKYPNGQRCVIDKLDINNNPRIHVNAVEYQISKMLDNITYTLEKIGADALLRIIHRFTPNDIPLVMVFVDKYPCTKKETLKTMLEHGIVRIGIDGIKDKVVISTVDSNTKVKTNRLVKRQTAISKLVVEYLEPVVKKYGEKVSVIPMLVITMSNIVNSILEVVDKELDTKHKEEYIKLYFDTINEREITVLSEKLNIDLDPESTIPISLVKGKPVTETNSYNPIPGEDLKYKGDDDVSSK